MTTDISSDWIIAVYEALEASPSGKIAVKLSTGEPGSNYLRTDLIGPLVESLESPTIVECNTAYGSRRGSTVTHYQLAKDHGYTDIADVDIMDEDGPISLPVTGGDNLTENFVGANFQNYDYFIVLSHFKGHSMAGFGGAIKNISIGIASSDGKAHIHSDGTGFQAFISGALLNSIPGIILQLVLIPAVMVALNRTRLVPSRRKTEQGVLLESVKSI